MQQPETVVVGMRRSKTVGFATSALLAMGVSFASTGGAYANPSKHQYTTALVTLSATPKGQTIGSITPATSVRVVKTHGKDVEVRLTGWAPKGYSDILFIAPNKHIIDARLKKHAHTKLLGTTKDAYGDVWDHISVNGWISKHELTGNVKSVWKKARNLYGNECSQCHSLHPASSHSINQWPSILKTMAKNANLNKQQKSLITKYLQMHAKNANTTKG